MAHPTEEMLARFALVRATRRENREVVLHLLQGCGACSRRISRELEASKAGLLPGPVFSDKSDTGVIALEALA